MRWPAKRGGLAANAFHHVAIAAQGIDVVVENLKAGLIEVRPQPLAGDGHTHAVSDSLTERAGGGFHAGGPAIFGMSRSLAIELAKSLDVIQSDGKVTQAFILRIYAAYLRQVEHGVKQHGGVAVRQDEAITVGPDRIRGIVAQELLPQTVGHRRQPHGRARMSRVGLLHRIHGQGADGVDAQRIQLFAGRQSLFAHCHERPLPYEGTRSTDAGGSALLPNNGLRNGKSLPYL